MVYRVSERRYAGWLIADLESKSEGCCVQFEGSPGLGLMTSCFQANAFKPFCLIELLARSPPHPCLPSLASPQDCQIPI
jgi:hypothetical protein